MALGRREERKPWRGSRAAIERTKTPGVDPIVAGGCVPNKSNWHWPGRRELERPEQRR